MSTLYRDGLPVIYAVNHIIPVVTISTWTCVVTYYGLKHQISYDTILEDESTDNPPAKY